MAKNVKFNRLKDKAFAIGSSKDADTIYFTTDTHQIILGGQIYGDWDYKTLAQLVGSSAIGSTTRPIYWNGSAFAQADAYPTVGNGVMSILANGFSTFAFSANQTSNDSVNFVGEKGVTVRGTTSGTKRVIISGTNHHTVAAKTEVVRAKKNSQDISLGQLYIQQIKCENLGEVLYVANLNDISSDASEKAPANANHARFIKSAVDDDFWIGLFGANATAGRYAFNITVSHTSGYEEHYKFLVVEDTPGDGTFSFVTDCPWDMTARYSSNKLVCFAKLPKDFIGYVRIRSERIHLSSGANSYCFGTWDSTNDWPDEVLQFTGYDSSIGWYIATGSSRDIASKFTTSQVNSLWSALNRSAFPAKPGGEDGPTNPMGKYTDSPVNMIVDLGSVSQGDYVTDFEINDMLLHELESKVGNHDVRITTLENAVTPSLGYWTYQDGGIYANNHKISTVTSAAATDAGRSFDQSIFSHNGGWYNSMVIRNNVTESEWVGYTAGINLESKRTFAHNDVTYNIGAGIELGSKSRTASGTLRGVSSYIDFKLGDADFSGELSDYTSAMKLGHRYYQGGVDYTMNLGGVDGLNITNQRDENSNSLATLSVGNSATRIVMGETNRTSNINYYVGNGGGGYYVFGTHNFNSDIIITPESGSGKTGKVEAPGGFFQTSDIRKKNVLGELDLNKAYDLIDKCQTIIYSLKDNPDRVDIGLIAQEVQQFFPEIVSEDKAGMLSLDYAKLTVVILRVLKDLIVRVSKLESK